MIHLYCTPSSSSLPLPTEKAAHVASVGEANDAVRSEPLRREEIAVKGHLYAQGHSQRIPSRGWVTPPAVAPSQLWQRLSVNGGFAAVTEGTGGLEGCRYGAAVKSAQPLSQGITRSNSLAAVATPYHFDSFGHCLCTSDRGGALLDSSDLPLFSSQGGKRPIGSHRREVRAAEVAVASLTSTQAHRHPYCDDDDVVHAIETVLGKAVTPVCAASMPELGSRAMYQARVPPPLPLRPKPRHHASVTDSTLSLKVAYQLLLDSEALSRRDLIIDFYASRPIPPTVLLSRLAQLTLTEYRTEPSFCIGDVQSSSAMELPSVIKAGGTSEGAPSDGRADVLSSPRPHCAQLVLPGALWHLVVRDFLPLLKLALQKDAEVALGKGVSVVPSSLHVSAAAGGLEIILSVTETAASRHHSFDALADTPLTEVWGLYNAVANFVSREEASKLIRIQSARQCSSVETYSERTAELDKVEAQESRSSTSFFPPSVALHSSSGDDGIYLTPLQQTERHTFSPETTICTQLAVDIPRTAAQPSTSAAVRKCSVHSLPPQELVVSHTPLSSDVSSPSSTTLLSSGQEAGHVSHHEKWPAVLTAFEAEDAFGASPLLDPQRLGGRGAMVLPQPTPAPLSDGMELSPLVPKRHEQVQQKRSASPEKARTSPVDEKGPREDARLRPLAEEVLPRLAAPLMALTQEDLSHSNCGVEDSGTFRVSGTTDDLSVPQLPPFIDAGSAAAILRVSREENMASPPVACSIASSTTAGDICEAPPRALIEETPSVHAAARPLFPPPPVRRKLETLDRETSSSLQSVFFNARSDMNPDNVNGRAPNSGFSSVNAQTAAASLSPVASGQTNGDPLASPPVDGGMVSLVDTSEDGMTSRHSPGNDELVKAVQQEEVVASFSKDELAINSTDLLSELKAEQKGGDWPPEEKEEETAEGEVATRTAPVRMAREKRRRFHSLQFRPCQNALSSLTKVSLTGTDRDTGKGSASSDDARHAVHTTKGDCTGIRDDSLLNSLDGVKDGSQAFGGRHLVATNEMKPIDFPKYYTEESSTEPTPQLSLMVETDFVDSSSRGVRTVHTLRKSSEPLLELVSDFDEQPPQRELGSRHSDGGSPDLGMPESASKLVSSPSSTWLSGYNVPWTTLAASLSDISSRSPSSTSLQPLELPSGLYLEVPGKLWETLLQERSGEMMRALNADLLDYPCAPLGGLQRCLMSVNDDGSLLVDFLFSTSSSNPALSTSQLRVALQRMPLLHLRALHDTAMALSPPRVQVQRRFPCEGIPEAAVTEKDRETVRSLFLSETVQLLGVAGEAVEAVEVTGIFVVDATVRLVPSEDAEAWRAILQAHEYPQLSEFLRELAFAHPGYLAMDARGDVDSGTPLSCSTETLTKSLVMRSSPQDTGTTVAHAVYEEGDFWACVIDHHPEALHAALTADIGLVLKDMATTVLQVTAVKHGDGALFLFSLRRTRLDPLRRLEVQLLGCTFPQTLALYHQLRECMKTAETDPVDDAAYSTVVEGDEWAKLISDHSSLVAETFVWEVFQCLQETDLVLTPSTVTVTELTPTETGVEVGYSVGCIESGATLCRGRVREAVSHYPFPVLMRVHDTLLRSHGFPKKALEEKKMSPCQVQPSLDVRSCPTTSTPQSSNRNGADDLRRRPTTEDPENAGSPGDSIFRAVDVAPENAASLMWGRHLPPAGSLTMGVRDILDTSFLIALPPAESQEGTDQEASCIVSPELKTKTEEPLNKVFTPPDSFVSSAESLSSSHQPRGSETSPAPLVTDRPSQHSPMKQKTSRECSPFPQGDDIERQEECVQTEGEARPLLPSPSPQLQSRPPLTLSTSSEMRTLGSLPVSHGLPRTLPPAPRAAQLNYGAPCVADHGTKQPTGEFPGKLPGVVTTHTRPTEEQLPHTLPPPLKKVSMIADTPVKCTASSLAPKRSRMIAPIPKTTNDTVLQRLPSSVPIKPTLPPLVESSPQSSTRVLDTHVRESEQRLLSPMPAPPATPYRLSPLVTPPPDETVASTGLHQLDGVKRVSTFSPSQPSHSLLNLAPFSDCSHSAVAPMTSSWAASNFESLLLLAGHGSSSVVVVSTEPNASWQSICREVDSLQKELRECFPRVQRELQAEITLAHLRR